MAISDWMDEARQVAAQCWCDRETQYVTMDPVLAEAVARRIAAWMDTAAQESRNTNFYRTLLRQYHRTRIKSVRRWFDSRRRDRAEGSKPDRKVEGKSSHRKGKA